MIPERPPSNATARIAKSRIDPDLLAFARKLRSKLTDAEQLMWALLRDRRFCGLKFRHQHPVGPYVLDFYCHSAKLAVELDGGQHNTDHSRRSDNKRTAFLEKRGIKVLRFWNHEVLEDIDAVLEVMHIALTARDQRCASVPVAASPGGRGGGWAPPLPFSPLARWHSICNH